MTAVYLDVKKSILEQIQGMVYKAGDKIPSERDLAEIYGVSRMTARQAVNELVNDGVVFREKGRGTFVATKQFSQKNLRGFTETLRELGYVTSNRVLEFSVVHSLKEISGLLEVPYSTQFYKIKRLRLGNDIPIALETLYIPIEKCPGLNLEDIEQSLYQSLKRLYGLAIEHVSYDIEACISNRMMMKQFEVQKPVALLKVHGINYSLNGKLLYEESYYRSDLYNYQVDIYKR